MKKKISIVLAIMMLALSMTTAALAASAAQIPSDVNGGVAQVATQEIETPVVAVNAPFEVEGMTVYVEPDNGDAVSAPVTSLDNIGIKPLSTYSYGTWQVAKGSSTKGSNSYYLRKDDICEASGAWAETKAGTIKIGFTDGTNFYYVSGTNGSASSTNIKILVAGNYNFMVKNEGTDTINITGFYTV